MSGLSEDTPEVPDAGSASADSTGGEENESWSEGETVRRERRKRIEALKQELVGGQLLTAAEVAEILDVHPRTVGEYIRAGSLKAHQFGGGWKISEHALREFVRDQSRLQQVPQPESAGESGGKLPWRRKGRAGYYCSFCGKGTEQVRRLIAGPNVYICNECIRLCNKILDEEAKAPARADGD